MVRSYDNAVMCYDNEVVTYDNKTGAMPEKEIPFVCRTETKNPFVNNQCIIADLSMQGKKLRRVNFMFKR